MNNKFSGFIVLITAILLGLPVASAQGYSETLLHQPQVMPARLAASGCMPYYTVRSGDTLSAIAWRCGVSTTRLAQVNGLRLTSLIYPGQRLVMPGATTSTSTKTTTSTSSTSAQTATGCPARYTVRAGDTLSAIAYRCSVSVTNLKQWNNLRSDLIWVGQVLNTHATWSSTTSTVRATPAAGITSGVATGRYATATPTPYWTFVALPTVLPTATPAIESPVSPW